MALVDVFNCLGESSTLLLLYGYHEGKPLENLLFLKKTIFGSKVTRLPMEFVSDHAKRIIRDILAQDERERAAGTEAVPA